jgi:hypothetical protein
VTSKTWAETAAGWQVVLRSQSGRKKSHTSHHPDMHFAFVLGETSMDYFYPQARKAPCHAWGVSFALKLLRHNHWPRELSSTACSAGASKRSLGWLAPQQRSCQGYDVALLAPRYGSIAKPSTKPDVARRRGRLTTSILDFDCHY